MMIEVSLFLLSMCLQVIFGDPKIKKFKKPGEDAEDITDSSTWAKIEHGQHITRININDPELKEELNFVPGESGCVMFQVNFLTYLL